MARQRIEVTRSVSLALKVVGLLLEEVPSFSEVDEYALVLGNIRQDSADCIGGDVVDWTERDFTLVICNRAPIARITLVESGYPAKWQVSEVHYCELENNFDQEDFQEGGSGVHFRGKGGWTTKSLGHWKELPFMLIKHLNGEFSLRSA